MKKMYLTYSRMKDYSECPKRYKFRYIDKLKIPEDLYYACSGTIKQKIVELLYNEDWFFREQPQIIKNHFKKSVPNLFNDWLKSVEKEGNHVDFKRYDRSPDALISEITNGVDQIFNIIKSAKLLVSPAENNRSEVDGVFEGKNFTLKGRIDLVIGDRRNSPVIIDGKDTILEKGEDYNDPDQLYAYALMNEYQYGVLPSKLGFMMFRFNKMRWIDPRVGLKTFEEKAEKIAERMLNNDFQASVGDACLWCKFKPKCKEYQTWMSSQGIKEDTL